VGTREQQKSAIGQENRRPSPKLMPLVEQVLLCQAVLECSNK